MSGLQGIMCSDQKAGLGKAVADDPIYSYMRVFGSLHQAQSDKAHQLLWLRAALLLRAAETCLAMLFFSATFRTLIGLCIAPDGAEEPRTWRHQASERPMPLVCYACCDASGDLKRKFCSET